MAAPVDPVPTRLSTLCLAALDPPAIGRFWAGMLGWTLTGGDGDDVWIDPPGGYPFRLRVRPTDTPKTVENLMHFDLTSESEADQAAKVARALELGGTHYDVGQVGDEGHVVLADPESNAFCVIEPGNGFLEGCGLVGALSSGGSPEVGRFWSAALGWPLVWDQDEETAIQSRDGGTKISWGGPPYESRIGADRWTYGLETSADLDAEIERLAGLGARRVGVADDLATLADPDGNRFTLRSAG